MNIGTYKSSGFMDDSYLKTVELEIVKQFITTSLNSMNYDQTDQCPCNEIRRVKMLSNEKYVYYIQLFVSCESFDFVALSI